MIAALFEGTYTVGGDRKFVPISPDQPPRKGEFKLGINPFLIRNGSLTALIDAGLGPFSKKDHYKLITNNLARHNLEPEDIRHVFCSHAHLDHIGGLLSERFGTYDVTFPNAAIWISGKDWQRFVEEADRNDKQELLRWAAFLETHADLRFIENQAPEPDEITMETTGGHTEFHQAVIYRNGSERALMLGDVLGRPEAINRKFVAKFDHDGKKSQSAREHYLQKALREQYLILTYHGCNGAIARLKDYDEKRGYDVEHITTGIVGHNH
jgi:glyoxylase-like metal-dependent hydrolase (beta-lactamase superfamily II)